MDEYNNIPAWAELDASVRLPELCAQGEGQSVEFKENLPTQGHDIGKSIAAFASSNAGEVLYGIANDGRVVGLPNGHDSEVRDRISLRILNAAKDIRPPVHPKVAWVLHEGKVVCVVKVDKGFEALYYSNHRPIVRRGGTSRPAEPSEVEQVFRLRYASGSRSPSLPSTRQIAKRMTDVLGLMNKKRHDVLTVADLARAMDLTSPADLDAVLAGHVAATFEMLDRFCSRFAVNKEWLSTGRGSPFLSTIEHRIFPEEYLSLINEEKPEAVYAVRSKSNIGESFVVIASDPLKCWCLPDAWHVSSHVGATGARNLVSLYVIFKQWLTASKPYMVLGRYIEPMLAESIINGEIFPGIIADLPLSHWWDDLTDLEHKWTTRERSSNDYGKEFVAAQDIIREALARSG